MRTYIIDTNYILRLLIGDVTRQKKVAERVFSEIEEKKARGLVSVLVVNEVLWLMDKYYDLELTQYIPSVAKLLSLSNIKIDGMKKRDLMRVFEQMDKTNLGFTDLCLLNLVSGDTELISFDKKLLGYVKKRKIN